MNRQKVIGMILGPLLLVLLCTIRPVGFTFTMGFTLGVIMWTVLWWAFEVMPLPVTSMIPLIAMSLSGIVKPATMVGYFLPHIIFLFIGIYIISSAFFRSGLARRWAYYLVTRRWVKGSTTRMGLAVLTVGFSLSIFVSNTATVALLLPVVLAISISYAAQYYQVDVEKIEISSSEFQALRFPVFLVFCALLGAQAGGFVLIVGTPVAIAANGVIEKMTGAPLGIVEWGIQGVPTGIAVAVVFFLIIKMIYKPEVRHFPRSETLAKEYEKCGKINAKEIVTILGFAIVVVLWILPSFLYLVAPKAAFVRALRNISYIYAVPMYVSFLYFLVPTSRKTWEPVLKWREAQADINWGIILLICGALSFASLLGDRDIGLGAYITNSIAKMHFGTTGLFVGTALIDVTLTNFVSSTGFGTFLATLLLPVAQSLGVSIKVFAVMLSAISCMDFSLPSGGAPGATAFGSGVLTIPKMLKGAIPCVLGGTLVILAISLIFAFI